MEELLLPVSLVDDGMNSHSGVLLIQGNSVSATLSFFVGNTKEEGLFPSHIFDLADFTSLEADARNRLLILFLNGLSVKARFMFANDAALGKFLEYLRRIVSLIQDKENKNAYIIDPHGDKYWVVAPFSAAMWQIDHMEAVKESTLTAVQRTNVNGLKFTSDEPPVKMSKEEFDSLFDDDGKLKEPANLTAFYNKDFEASVLPKLCSILLDANSASRSNEEREEELKRRRTEYREIKRQWKATTPRQWRNNEELREIIIRLENDLDNCNIPDEQKPIAFDILITMSVWSWGTSSYVAPMLTLLTHFLPFFISAVDSEHVIFVDGRELSFDDAEADIFWCFNSFYDKYLFNIVHHSNDPFLKTLIPQTEELMKSHFPDLLQLIYQKTTACFDFINDDVIVWFTSCFGKESIQTMWTSAWTIGDPLTFLKCFIPAFFFVLAPELCKCEPQNSSAFMKVLSDCKKNVDVSLVLQNTAKIADYIKHM